MLAGVVCLLMLSHCWNPRVLLWWHRSRVAVALSPSVLQASVYRDLSDGVREEINVESVLISTEDDVRFGHNKTTVAYPAEDVMVIDDPACVSAFVDPAQDLRALGDIVLGPVVSNGRVDEYTLVIDRKEARLTASGRKQYLFGDLMRRLRARR